MLNLYRIDTVITKRIGITDPDAEFNYVKPQHLALVAAKIAAAAASG